MDAIVAFSVLTSAFLGAVMLLLPHISPRRYFFAITVPPGFRDAEAGRASLRRFHWSVGAATLIAIAAAAAFVRPGGSPAAAFLPFLPVVAALAAFLRERARVRLSAGPAAQPAPQTRAVEHEHLPRWTILAAGPFALPLAAALYLRAHWDEIPARFPVHWGVNGQPNGWALKTVRGVYGPLIFSAGMMLLIILIGLAVFYGSRRSPMRRPMMALMIGVMYFLSIGFTAAGLLPLVHVPAVVIVAPLIVFVIAVLVWSYRMANSLPAEETPDECWTLGGIYYNRADPALFVQKRIGFGYTFNFGNRISWVVIGAFAAAIAGMVFLLPK